jgi:hypothetical protein
MTDSVTTILSDDKHQKDLPKTRDCLRCGSEFLGSWSGERICPQCKRTSAWRNGMPHNFASRR